jgi:hypothetical protein
MKLLPLLRLLAAVPLASLSFAAPAAAPLTAEHQTFLSQYEAVRAALASDNLDAAKKAAASLSGDTAKAIANADSIKAAREAFKSLSKDALKIAKGQPGYFHAHCPMVPGNQGDWVQKDKTINNPYFGKAMLKCGEIKE